MQLMIVVEHLQRFSLNFHTKEEEGHVLRYEGYQITNVLKDDNGLWSERTLNKLPDDSGEVRKTRWSGWRFDSQL